MERSKDNNKREKSTRRRRRQRRRPSDDGDSNSDGEGILGHGHRHMPTPEIPTEVKPSRYGDADGVNALCDPDPDLKKKPQKSALSHKKTKVTLESKSGKTRITPPGESTVKLKLKPEAPPEESTVKLKLKPEAPPGERTVKLKLKPEAPPGESTVKLKLKPEAPPGESTVKLKLKPEAEAEPTASAKTRHVKKPKPQDAQIPPKSPAKVERKEKEVKVKETEFQTDTEHERPPRPPKKVLPKISISEFVPQPKPKTEQWKHFKESMALSLARQYERFRSHLTLDFSNLHQQQQQQQQGERKRKKSKSKSKSSTQRVKGQEETLPTPTPTAESNLISEGEVISHAAEVPARKPKTKQRDPNLKLKTEESTESQPKVKAKRPLTSKSIPSSRSAAKSIEKKAISISEQLRKNRADRMANKKQIQWAWGFVLKKDPVPSNRKLNLFRTLSGPGPERSKAPAPPKPPTPPKESSSKYSAAKAISRVKAKVEKSATAKASDTPPEPESPRINPYMPPPLNLDFLEVAKAQAMTLKPLEYWDREINQTIGIGDTRAGDKEGANSADMEYYPRTAFTAQFAHLLPKSHQYESSLDEFGIERNN